MKETFLKLVDLEWYPNCDHWGVAMSLAFDIAGEGYKRNLPNVLDFRCGLGGIPDIEDEYRREAIEAMPDNELLELMKFTNRVLNALKHAGKDY